MKPVKRYFYIDAGYASFGIVAKDGIVIDVAPIAAWMKGMALKEIRPFLLSKKAKVIEIKMK
jgi:hypothetical protein